MEMNSNSPVEKDLMAIVFSKNVVDERRATVLLDRIEENEKNITAVVFGGFVGVTRELEVINGKVDELIDLSREEKKKEKIPWWGWAAALVMAIVSGFFCLFSLLGAGVYLTNACWVSVLIGLSFAMVTMIVGEKFDWGGGKG